MSSETRRTYTRRQRQISMEECVLRQPARDLALPVRPLPRRTDPTIAGVRWTLLVSAALGGMGTGAGVMALLMPAPAPRAVLPSPPAAGGEVATIPPRPDVLIPTADNRALVAAILRDGGRVDPFEPAARDPFAPPPALVALARPTTRTAPGRRVKSVVPVLPPPPMLPRLSATPPVQPLPPAAALAARQALSELPPAPVLKLPVSVTEQQPARLLDSPLPTAAHVPLRPPATPGTLIDAPDLQSAPTPVAPPGAAPMAPLSAAPAAPTTAPSTEATTPATVALLPSANEAGMRLLGIAVSGDNRVALIRTSPDATPFSVSVGDTVDGWQVRTIDDASVMLVQGEQQRVLKIGG